MKKQNKVIKPNVVGGGVAIPLGNNFYFMRGRKHEFGGIDVGPDNKNGLEVEGGEVMQMGGKHVKVYSSLPILNGKSPAELVIAGLDPNKVFNAQERFKDVNKLNDDGTRKARFGKRKKAEVGTMWIEDEFGNIIENDEPIIPEPFSYDNPIKGPIKDMAYRIMTQMPGADRNMSHVREAVNHHIYKKPVPLHYTGGASPEMERDDEYATWDNPKRNLAKLYLTGESGDIEQIPDNSRGFNYTNYLKKNKYKAKTYKGELLPDEVTLPKGYEYVINNMETSGKSVNAYNHDNEFDDVANHKQQIGRDEKGNLEIQASDVWDFQPNDYAKLWKGKFKIKPYIQASMLNTIGKPFILRDYSKIKFTDNENDVNVPNSVKHWLYEYPIKKEDVDGMPHYSLENNEIEMIFDKHNINKKPIVRTNTQTYKPERKRLGGFNRHFTINGNVMNKAGYVPSTGKLPKAYLGTVASIDKHVTRKDKDGRVANIKLDKITPPGISVNPVKPPTQLTIKTPETGTETKNKGTWWRDNGSDLISGLAKGGASLASYLINRNMLNDLKYQGQPIFTPAAKLKTKININPQIDAVNRTTAARNANVSTNTASSKVRNARMNNNYIDRLGYLNELYEMKENKETELINADKLNQQEITKGNIQAYNDWVEKKQNFDNTVREKQSENAVSFVSNLASGVDDIISNRQKRKQFKQNVAAYMASHPNVSPELLESYGLDIFDNKKIIEKRVIKPNKENYKGTGKTKKEYADWLKEKDPAKYEIWAKREKYNRN